MLQITQQEAFNQAFKKPKHGIEIPPLVMTEKEQEELSQNIGNAIDRYKFVENILYDDEKRNVIMRLGYLKHHMCDPNLKFESFCKDQLESYKKEYAKLKKILPKMYKKHVKIPLYLDQLMQYSKRWKWWTLVFTYPGLLIEENIQQPVMGFETDLSSKKPPYKMIAECVEPFYGQDRSTTFNYLIDFMLHYFGHLENIDHIPQENQDHFMKTIDIKVFIRYPGDFLGAYFEEHFGFSHSKGSAFFTTPSSICEMMVKMCINESPFAWLQSFNDPCCGTMRMGLFASDKGVVQITGQDISHTIYKVALVNAYLYLPSVVKPCKALTEYCANHTVESHIKRRRNILVNKLKMILKKRLYMLNNAKVRSLPES